MPRCKVTGAIVSHIWDDDSRSDYEIKVRTDDQGIQEVWVSETTEQVIFRPESWPEIRDQIQSMMDEIESES